MHTQRLFSNDTGEAADFLRSGGLVAIPTETVYGLGANGLDPGAVARIFEAKGRPQDNPLILHVPDDGWLERYCQNIPETAYVLTKRFWPGPLTIILPRRAVVPDVVTAGLDTVGVRCPAHPLTRAIIAAAGVPVAAPSANTSGKPSPTTAAHVLDDMDGKIDAVVDGGPCSVGVESTIVDLTCTPPRLLRPGGVTLEELREALGEVDVDPAVTRLMGAGEQPRAPGMKYRHYAPRAPVTVVAGPPEESAAYIRSHLGEHSGVICFDEFAARFPAVPVELLGPVGDKAEQARRIFDALRAFDATGVTEIFAQCPDEGGIGLAIANRLNKAAGFHIIELRPCLEGETMKVVGITGPSGAGKTTVLGVLREFDAHVIDCDALYHRLLEESAPMLGAIWGRFGRGVFDREGKLDRKALGNVVFHDAQALADLNEITHAQIRAEVERQIGQARTAGRRAAAVDAIALLESGLGELCDVTVAVTAPAQVRAARLMAREGISREYAEARIAAQKPDAFFEERCDHVLRNDGDSAALCRERARALFEEIL